ncbi:MAG TPA: saccharopine dehydrogenase NADP-binding domain-containing protein [Gammaproteobacteria bacterium]|jgi:saccharopine dehydrogenase-like NADP-dependent oxidoreductase|nr:saccharopine dehydrogenase NADP-binding domain-containing protein [Gammaproteobacteria bacterium]
MHRVLVLGAGKIGSLLSGLLAASGDYQVDLGDVNGHAAQAAAAGHKLANIKAHQVDAGNKAALEQHLKAHPADAVISSLPYFCNPPVAEVARKLNLHYFDLTEDVEVTRAVTKISQGASTVFAPQCGLAPGFISIAGNELMSHFDEVHDAKLRVGALPQNPGNMTKYSLTWSSDGVINEYGNLCYGVADSKPAVLMPLEGLETIQLEGRLYEAFNTSGGLGSLAETYEGKVRNLTYKTMRYPGHCEIMRILMNDLRLNEHRDEMKTIMERAVPRTVQDVVLVYVSVTGMQHGKFMEENYVNAIFPQEIAGKLWSAIQVTTSAGVCAVVDLVLKKPDAYKGLVKQEQFKLADVLANRFGKAYAQAETAELSARLVRTGEAAKQFVA